MTNTNRYELTAEEREALMNATPEEIALAAAEAVKDKAFWQQIGNAFLEGFVRGLAND